MPPAGPAGSGKTEITKDLAMTKARYAFNCSEQIGYKGMCDVFKGFGASGSLGCFEKCQNFQKKALNK